VAGVRRKLLGPFIHELVGEARHRKHV
jgi:hypothetical protein